MGGPTRRSTILGLAKSITPVTTDSAASTRLYHVMTLFGTMHLEQRRSAKQSVGRAVRTHTPSASQSFVQYRRHALDNATSVVLTLLRLGSMLQMLRCGLNNCFGGIWIAGNFRHIAETFAGRCRIDVTIADTIMRPWWTNMLTFPTSNVADQCTPGIQPIALFRLQGPNAPPLREEVPPAWSHQAVDLPASLPRR